MQARVMRPILIIIPLYRAPELICPLVNNLREMKVELGALNCRTIFINDSPDDEPLLGAIKKHIEPVSRELNSTVHTNGLNVGFIKSVNFGLQIALAEGRDVLLLNSDALLTPGALREMAEVAQLDPLTSVVSPRSNNATICNSPYASKFRNLPMEEALASHLQIEKYLPRVSYVPTAVGFCLFIRHQIISEFGFFDEIYGQGYNEENDFISRCNRCGYRAVLANRAFVYHSGSVSFEQSNEGRTGRESKNRKLLDKRYPEYGRSISRYFDSIDYRAQLLTSALVPDDSGRLRLHFDCRNLGAYHNGTFEHTKRLVAAFAKSYSERFRITVLCNRAAYDFHRLGGLSGVGFIIGDDTPVLDDNDPPAIAIRLAQPFRLMDLISLSGTAPISGFLMLDTIALDCSYLDEQDLKLLWEQMLQCSAFVGFNSTFTMQQFSRRFSVPDRVTTFVSLCSTDPQDYVDSLGELAASSVVPEKNIVVIGNKFAHKHVDETVNMLRPLKKRPDVFVFGAEYPDRDGIRGVGSGYLDQQSIEEMYKDAAVVVFPSHYEGFGLPIVEALSRKRPIIARKIPVFEEIRRRIPLGKNIHLFDTTQEIVDFAITLPKWEEDDSEFTQCQSWEDAAGDLARGISRSLDCFDFQSLRTRLLAVDSLATIAAGQAELEQQSKRLQAYRTVVRDDRGEVHDQGKRPKQDGSRRGHLSPSKARELVWEGNRLLTILPSVAKKSSLRRRRLTQGEGGALSVSRFSALSRMSSGEHNVLALSSLMDVYSLRIMTYRILVVAEKLALHGRAEFSITTGVRPTQTRVFAERENGIRVLCLNAGLLADIKSGEGRKLWVTATKVHRWDDFVSPDVPAERFLRDAYLACFGRMPDHHSAEWISRISGGLARTEVARKLFSSAERMSILESML